MKLFNAGKRKITVGDLEFNPGETVDFKDPEVAERLRKLYAGEVRGIEDAVKVFDAAPDKVLETVEASESENSESKDDGLAPPPTRGRGRPAKASDDSGEVFL